MHTDSFSSTATASSTAGLDTVFLQVRVIGVTRPGIEICFGVVLGSLIFVFHKECNGRSERHAVFEAGLKVNQVFFVTLKVAGGRIGVNN